MKVKELSGGKLDYWVAKAKGGMVIRYDDQIVYDPKLDNLSILSSKDGCHYAFNFHPSSDWRDGGPLIEREKITINPEWIAGNWDETVWMGGETILIAAMRCYVASKFGEEVPD